ncbi:hypothetical protein R6Q59_015656 [Mikania micrantha]
MIPDSIDSLIWPATLCSAGLLEPGRRHAGAGHRLSASHRPPQYCMSAPWHQFSNTYSMFPLGYPAGPAQPIAPSDKSLSCFPLISNLCVLCAAVRWRPLEE